MRILLSLFTMALLAVASAATGYFVQADVVRGARGEPQGRVCVANTVFYPGEQIVWRAYVYDASTDERLTQEQIEARGITVTATLGNEVSVPLNFTPHPPGDTPNKELFWAGGWQIPADYPTGMFEWTVEVQDEAGNTAVFEPIGHKIGLGSLTIVPAQAENQPPAQAQQPEAQQEQAQMSGQQIYQQQCAVCHGQNGEGVVGPAFAGNEGLQDIEYVISQILYGGGAMPAFAEQLTPQQIAAVASYERTSWGNDFGAITVEQVQQIADQAQ